MSRQPMYIGPQAYLDCYADVSGITIRGLPATPMSLESPFAGCHRPWEPGGGRRFPNRVRGRTKSWAVPAPSLSLRLRRYQRFAGRAASGCGCRSR